MTISYVDRQALNALAKVVCDDLEIGEVAYGWLGSAFSVAYLVGAPVAGFLLDRLGVRRGLAVSVLVWSGVAALHALVPQLAAVLGRALGATGVGALGAIAPAFATLFLLRIALGLAEAPSFPGATQVVHRALPPAERARGVGVLFTGSSIGAMLAPFVAVRIYRATNWHFAFLGTALIGLLWLPLWLLVTRGEEARRLLAAPPPVAGPRPSAIAMARHPAVLRAAAPIVASAPVMAFMLLFGAKWLTRTFDVPQGEVDRYLWPAPLVFDLCAVVFGFLASRARARQAPSDHRPPRALFAVAAALTCVAGLVPLAPTPALGVAAGAVAAGGVGGIFAIVMSDLLSRVPRESVSLAAGLTAAAQSLAYIVASPLIGLSVQATHAYGLALVALGAWVVPGSLVWLAVRPPGRVD